MSNIFISAFILSLFSCHQDTSVTLQLDVPKNKLFFEEIVTTKLKNQSDTLLHLYIDLKDFTHKKSVTNTGTTFFYSINHPGDFTELNIYYFKNVRRYSGKISSSVADSLMKIHPTFSKLQLSFFRSLYNGNDFAADNMSERQKFIIDNLLSPGIKRIQFKTILSDSSKITSVTSYRR